MTPAENRVVEIIAEEAIKADIKPEDITGPSHKPNIVQARHTAMWRARQETGLSFNQLGWLFRKDHAVVYRATKGARP